MRDSCKDDPYADVPSSISDDTLVDILSISVDKALPREERIAEFVRQIQNPYRFRCGHFIVSASFAEGGPVLEDCLLGIMR